MIRINLLPFRTARQNENVRRQMSYILLSFLLTLAVLAFVNIGLGNKVATLNGRIEVTQQQVDKYQKDAEQVDVIKKKLATLKKKTQVINDLENNRQWPVRLLDTMTQVLVPKRMWFTLLEVKNGGVRIDGIALDNKTVADFMTRLEKTAMFSSVELNRSERKVIANSALKQFQVHCRLIMPASAAGPEAGQSAPAKKK